MTQDKSEYRFPIILSMVSKKEKFQMTEAWMKVKE